MNTKSALIMEIESLRRLVKRRQDWLGKQENRLRRTYQAVAEDTRQLERRLQELKEEYREETETEFINHKK